MMKVTINNSATATINNRGYSVVYPEMGTEHYLVSKNTAEYVNKMSSRSDNYHFKIDALKVVKEI